ncbi:phosphate-binding protein [Geomonas limicola]|uniref:Phosphate-binding protein n=1 Tax=Geomonas limicola TaxID=2740186 RepID=A0A6V8N3U1_9BACT|nr:phosphate ABC transporter substrate-binding protein PstS [Geomonas limicola]GFO67186.1 phosphate-binding protein [Geomonas limicola]
MFSAARFARIVIVALILVAAGICQARAEVTLTGAGATFPYPLYQKWFKDYASLDPGVSFSYQAIGSGGGIREILAGTVDFGASDKYLSDAELKKAPGTLLHIPTVLGAVAVSYQLPGVTRTLKLTPDTLGAIFMGTISSWNDPRLLRDNPELALPDQPIVVVHRLDASGTTSIFTDYLSRVNELWGATLGSGTSISWPVGVGAKGSGEVAQQIRATPYSIGYLEIAYAVENELPTAALKNRSGTFVKPTMLSTRAAAAHLKKIRGDHRVSLVNQAGKDVYPVVGLTWLLVYQHQKDAAKGKKLVEFLNWELKKAEKMTSTLYYTPLPKNLADEVAKTIRSITW